VIIFSKFECTVILSISIISIGEMD